jgi:hypothetical protein
MLDLLEKIRSQMLSQKEWREENGHAVGQIDRWIAYMSKVIEQAHNIAQAKENAELRAQIMEIESARVREYLATIGSDWDIAVKIPESFYASISTTQKAKYFFDHHGLDMAALKYVQNQNTIGILNSLHTLKTKATA